MASRNLGRRICRSFARSTDYPLRPRNLIRIEPKKDGSLKVWFIGAYGEIRHDWFDCKGNLI